MAEITVKNVAGKKAGTVALDEATFAIQPNVPVMHQVVTAQLANRRAGTQSTKTRSEVRGGGAKPYRQKGTGRARQGSTNSPQFSGGGIALGPKPRSYRQRTPKKMIKLALRSALSDRASEDKVVVVDTLGPRRPEDQGRRRGARRPRPRGQRAGRPRPRRHQRRPELPQPARRADHPHRRAQRLRRPLQRLHRLHQGEPREGHRATSVQRGVATDVDGVPRRVRPSDAPASETSSEPARPKRQRRGRTASESSSEEEK